jgi:hypothetical protein
VYAVEVRIHAGWPQLGPARHAHPDQHLRENPKRPSSLAEPRLIGSLSDGQDLAEHVDAFRQEFNTIRPHEAFDWARPLADPPKRCAIRARNRPD